MSPRFSSLMAGLALPALASACAVGPTYHTPSTPAPAAYRELNGWKPGQPAAPDLQLKWWTVFGDDQLNTLEDQVVISNQTLKASEAAYREARAIVREDQASFFPTVDLSGSGTRTKGAAARTTSGGTVVGGTGTTASNHYTASLGASWEPDVWGRIGRTVEGAKAEATASADDLAAATLSAQAELAIDYLQLREFDEEKRLLDLTIAGYEESLRIAQNRYDIGVNARGDVLQAQSQLATAKAQATDIARQRAISEHAIAVLTGQAPEGLSIAPARWTLKTPDVPVSVPSALLERRPDIAAAERRVAAANAQIGVQTAAYFPDITLSGSYGGSATKLGDIASAPARAWSLGIDLAETVLDFGRRHAAVQASEAVYDEQVANYRQTVLEAFRAVDDNLAATRILADVEQFRQQSSQAADDAERIALNQYRQGIIDQTALIVAQSSARDARISSLSASLDRMTTAVSLIEALGGGWSAH